MIDSEIGSLKMDTAKLDILFTLARVEVKRTHDPDRITVRCGCGYGVERPMTLRNGMRHLTGDSAWGNILRGNSEGHGLYLPQYHPGGIVYPARERGERRAAPAAAVAVKVTDAINPGQSVRCAAVKKSDGVQCAQTILVHGTPFCKAHQRATRRGGEVTATQPAPVVATQPAAQPRESEALSRILDMLGKLDSRLEVLEQSPVSDDTARLLNRSEGYAEPQVVDL